MGPVSFPVEQNYLGRENRVGQGPPCFFVGSEVTKHFIIAEAATARLESLWEKAQRLTPFGKDDGE